MAKRKSKPRRVPLGKAIRWTQEEIDEFSIVTATDIDKMRAFWRRAVSSQFRDLIDAQEVDDTADDIANS